MIRKLVIEQFVIIDRLELDLQTGLTVVTGETGAGKSIVLDAIGLVYGDPINSDFVRAGATQSYIEATFAPRQTSPVWKHLSDHGLITEPQEQFAIVRTITREGKGDIKVNGKDVDLDVLKKIGTLLGEIHGQFANQTLLEPSNQLHLLDLSGSFPPELHRNVADALHDVQRYTQELADENTFLARHMHELRETEELVAQFDKLGMKEGFYEEVKAEHSRLLIAKETGLAFQSILSQLIAGNGALKSLNTANHIFSRQENFERDKVQTLSTFLSAALENARAAVDEMERLAPEYAIDTRPLNHYGEILETLNKIAEDHKIETDNLFKFYDEQSTKLKRLRGGKQRIAKLNELLAEAKNAYLEHCDILSDKRMEAAKVLSAAVTAELPPLKLMRAQFAVVVEKRVDIPWTEAGLNVCTFTARMNPGMPFTPISETASGGELVRLVLALKVVLQKVQPDLMLVFDEVDTGIGGSTAAAVGERIAKLADTTQVLVITHSPQVASRGDQHLNVSKKTDGITTVSQLVKLTLEQRIDEISRMLAGDVLTSQSHAAAKSLIDEAQTAAAIRRKALQEQTSASPLPSPPISQPEPRPMPESEAKPQAELEPEFQQQAAPESEVQLQDELEPEFLQQAALEPEFQQQVELEPEFQPQVELEPEFQQEPVPESEFITESTESLPPPSSSMPEQPITPV